MANEGQGKLLIYMIMLFGLVMGFLWNSQTDATAAVPVLDNRFSLTSLKNLQSAKIDDTLLSADAFKSLKIFGSLPVPVDAPGKDNPFQ